MPGETLAKLAKQMERQEIPPGTAVVREGEPGDRFYVLFAGMMSVRNSALGTREVLRPGDYFAASVVQPLALDGSLHGSPAWGYRGPLDDLLKLGRELLAPSVVAPETLDEATSVQFPGLPGVLPGWGRMEPNDWGLAFELRDAKAPHWTSGRNSAHTFGHFGAAGTFLWVDPELGAACAVLTDREFGDWAVEAWPRFNEAVVASLGSDPAGV